MDREPKAKKLSEDERIEKAAERGAQKVILLQRSVQSVNHYRATEELLRAYPKRLRLMAHPEEFDFFREGRSKDISIAPPSGSGVVDKIEMAELFTEARKRAYAHELLLLHETEYAIAPFRHLPEFAVIRMLYFNEDINGMDRGTDARRMTWEEMAAELDSAGIRRTITVLRRWRNRLVREMTVMLFGADGALSICRSEASPSGCSASKQDDRKGKGEKNAAEMEAADGPVCSEDSGQEHIPFEIREP